MALRSEYLRSGNSIAAMEFERASREGAAQRNPNPITLAQVQALPSMQQAALLTMHETQVRRSVVAKLLEDAQGKPQHEDYYALVVRGWARKNPADQWHKLTLDGITAARLLEPVLCKSYGIHLLSETGAGRTDVHWRCCCGWTTTTRKGDFTNSNARRQFVAHIASADGVARLQRGLKVEGA